MTTMMRMTEAQLAEWRAKRGERRTNAVTQARALDNPPAAEPAKRASKYGNQKTVVDGITFDSKAEAARWVDLQQLEKAGVITQLQRQVRYELVPKGRTADGKAVRSVAYIADFVYCDEHGKTITEDTKGFLTESYRLKKKLLLHVFGIEIKEVFK